MAARTEVPLGGSPHDPGGDLGRGGMGVVYEAEQISLVNSSQEGGRKLPESHAQSRD